MDKTIYEIEKKLGLAASQVCSDAEVNAIKTILAKGKPLPEGIFKDKRGRYCRFDAGLTDEAEKDRIVMYDTLLYLKRIYRLLIVSVTAFCLIGAGIACILLLK